MSDDTRPRPDTRALFEMASGQLGYVTAAQLRACGYGTDDVAHAHRAGRLLRVHRGVYRLRDYPSSPHEATMAGWLAAGAEAVVSHESALELHALADVIADDVHVTLPRARRSRRPPAGVIVHTSGRPFASGEVVTREGMRVTGAERTILDVAERGGAPEQVELAVRQAVRRGLIAPAELSAAAAARGSRVSALVAGALAATPA